jgi:hypothetical protein
MVMDEGSLLLSVDLSRKPTQLSVAGKTITVIEADNARLLYVLSSAGLFGMGSQAYLYTVAEDLVDKMIAWSKECGCKTDADCSRNLTAIRKTAFKAAEWPAELASDDSGDASPDGKAIGGGKAGWKAHWRLYESLFKYHGDCFDRYDTDECKAN